MRVEIPIGERLLTEKQAAQVTGYSVFWFQKMRWKGGGPGFVKLNGHAVRYPVDVLLEWINAHGIQRSTAQIIPGKREARPIQALSVLLDRRGPYRQQHRRMVLVEWKADAPKRTPEEPGQERAGATIPAPADRKPTPAPIGAEMARTKRRKRMA